MVIVSLPFCPVATELQIIRIIQEALTNVRKHAGAKHVWVRIVTDNNQVESTIEDDGHGFNVSRVKRDGWPQFGLQTMKERVESVKGTLDISSKPGEGTKVTLRVPLEISVTKG